MENSRHMTVACIDTLRNKVICDLIDELSDEFIWDSNEELGYVYFYDSKKFVEYLAKKNELKYKIREYDKLLLLDM